MDIVTLEEKRQAHVKQHWKAIILWVIGLVLFLVPVLAPDIHMGLKIVSATFGWVNLIITGFYYYAWWALNKYIKEIKKEG